MKLRVLARDVGFAEGPTITSEGNLIFISVDQGRVYQLAGVEPTIHTQVNGGPNGATCDGEGRIYVAQNGGNWLLNPKQVSGSGLLGGVQRVTPSGQYEWLSREPYAPNDLCFGPDGLLYITDPNRDGLNKESRIWRCHPATGDSELLIRVPWFANGIAFDQDDFLYVASTGDRKILRFEVTATGLHSEQVVCQLDGRAPDGIAFDIDGNLIVGAVGGVTQPGEIQVWASNGTLLERVRLGEGNLYTNIALSGDGKLIVTDSSAGQLLCIDHWPGIGLALYPLRSQNRVSPRLSTNLASIDASSSQTGIKYAEVSRPVAFESEALTSGIT